MVEMVKMVKMVKNALSSGTLQADV
jgi:hypothetical protein